KKLEEEKDSSLEKVVKNKGQALLSKKLAIIKKDLSLEIFLEDLKYTKKNGELIKYLKSLGFKTLVNRLDSTPTEENLL
ncbi:hypothetical protein AKJ56_00800, partial [candidate division MSBL1 archaeon SCGC-AAA382N08]